MQARVVQQQRQYAREPPRIGMQRERIDAGDLDLRVMDADLAKQSGQVDRRVDNPFATALKPRELDKVTRDPPSAGGTARRGSVVPGLVGQAQRHRALRLRCDRI